MKLSLNNIITDDNCINWPCLSSTGSALYNIGGKVFAKEISIELAPDWAGQENLPDHPRPDRATKKWPISSSSIYDKKVNIGLTVVDSGIRTVTLLLAKNFFQLPMKQ